MKYYYIYTRNQLISEIIALLRGSYTSLNIISSYNAYNQIIPLHIVSSVPNYTWNIVQIYSFRYNIFIGFLKHFFNINAKVKGNWIFVERELSETLGTGLSNCPSTPMFFHFLVANFCYYLIAICCFAFAFPST